MKDMSDSKTLDLLPAKAVRGRPRSDGSLTNAQRQAAFRKRNVSLSLSLLDLQRLLDLASHLDPSDPLLVKLRRLSDKSIPSQGHGDSFPVTVTENVRLIPGPVAPIESQVTLTKKEGSCSVGRSVKYVHPDDPFLTWTGRGRQPVWFTSALDAGFSVSDLEV